MQGKYTEAEPLYTRSLAILQKVHGVQHPVLLVGVHNLAHFYYIQGKYSQAEPFFERLYKLHEKILGADHPAIVPMLETYAVILRETGRGAEAAEKEAKAKAIRSRSTK